MPERTLDILLLCYEYPPIGGGGGVGAQQYAEAWAARGHRVTVITGGARPLPRREDRSGVSIFRVSVLGKRDRATSTSLSMLAYVGSGLRFLVGHRHALRRVDIVNTHFSLPSGPLGVAASRILSAPNVLTIIGGDIYDPSKRSSPHRNPALRGVNRFIMKSADRVVAISSDTRERARKFYGVERPIEVINYGFKPMSRSAGATATLPRAPGEFWLIGVGRLVKRKGFEYLLRALADLPAHVQLALVGDGPLEDELKAVARREGVEGRVLWLGYQDRDSVLAYLEAADCFVLSSLHEGLGIALQEAMYAGLPIVSTNNGGQVDLVRHGRNGLLVEPGDPHALAEAIRRLITDPDLAAALGRRNRTDIADLFIESNCQRYLRLFRETLGDRRRDTPAPD